MVLEPKELKESVREQAFQTFRQYIPKVETKHFEKHYHYKCLANFGQAKGWTEEDGTVVELAPYLSLKPGDMIDVLENEQGLFFIKDGYEYSTQKFVLDELFEEIREKNEIRTKQIEHKEEK